MDQKLAVLFMPDDMTLTKEQATPMLSTSTVPDTGKSF